MLKVDADARIPLSDVATAAYWTGFPLMHLAFSKAPDASFDHETHQGNIYIAYNYGTHLLRRAGGPQHRGGRGAAAPRLPRRRAR